MKKAKVYNFGKLAGFLIEKENKYLFAYKVTYSGPPISLAMPLSKKLYYFDSFPPFFDGLLPEGTQLEALLRFTKVGGADYFNQLLIIGKDLVGSVTIESDI